MTALTARLAAAGCMVLGLAQPAPSTTAELIASYADWVNGRRTGVELIAVDLDATRHELARFNPASLPADPAANPADVRESQRRLISAFALELAAVGSTKHATAAARLVEWACPLVRSHTSLNDFDRAWQLAALSVLEGGIDSQTLHEHLDHVRTAFADDPRVQLARAIAEEQYSAPAEVLTRSVAAADLARAREALARAEGERFRSSERAIARFRELEKDDTLRAEAMLRMGHVQLRIGREEAALASWTGLEALTKDRYLIYLVHLFRGLAYERLNRVEEARDSYQAALGVSPRAHSAMMRLAALGFRHGEIEVPDRLVSTLLADDDPRRDPWWSYYAGDWRFWYPRIERVRELLKSQVPK